nr:hypothetical protein [Tanacetum cinerariifolium]
MKDRPWTILGDFNACLDPAERSTRGSKFTTSMHDFRNCVEEIDVEDIAMTGLNFTWNKKPGKDGGLLKKLDRVLGNSHFMSIFPLSYAHFLLYMLSDHTPAMLVMPLISNAKPKPFKFHNYLTPKDDFIPVVRRVWNSKIDGFSMFLLVSKLKLLKKPLRKLNFKQGNLFENVVRLKAKLAIVQSSMSDDPHNKDLREEELRVLKDYKAALKDEELFLRQKAKVEWLKASDKNSKYFHNVVRGRCNRNIISYIENMDDVPFHGNNVGDQLVNHFKNVLGQSSEVLPFFDLDSLFVKKLPVFEALNLVRIVSNKEIKLALFDIKGNKAPGPDEINDTVIFLVPKVASPSKVSDYRPIACCNVVYKIISKVICNRLKEGLRQGDPLSPYLFTLVMEVFNLVLRREIDKNPTFRFHCDSSSVAILKNAISIFGGLFGLLPNLTKCTVFFEVPLISKRLYVKDCYLLIDKARKRLLDWKNKSFSFAGRL